MNMNPDNYRNPIPKEKLSRVALFFEMIITNPNFYELRHPLLVHLTASEVGLVRHLLGVDLAPVRNYLNPLRDIEPSMTKFNKLIESGHKVMILGVDCVDLMERILRPEAYWSSVAELMTEYHALPDTISIWVVALPPDIRGGEHLINRLRPASTMVVNAHDMMTKTFDTKILIQAKHMFPTKPTLELADVTNDTLIRNYIQMIRDTTSTLDLRAFQPGFSGLHSQTKCRISDLDVAMEWDEIYPVAAIGLRDRDISGIQLAYVDASLDPLVIREGKRLPIRDRVIPTASGSQSVILWTEVSATRVDTIRAFEFGSS